MADPADFAYQPPAPQDESSYGAREPIRYDIYRRGEVVGNAKTSKSAWRKVNRLDNEYGGAIHSHRPVYGS